MRDLNEINPHLALAQSESYVSPQERSFSRVCDAVAKALGVPHLDGDTACEGYSIDQTHDMFLAGADAEQITAEFRHQQAQRLQWLTELAEIFDAENYPLPQVFRGDTFRAAMGEGLTPRQAWVEYVTELDAERDDDYTWEGPATW